MIIFVSKHGWLMTGRMTGGNPPLPALSSTVGGGEGEHADGFPS
jgi:hypothetical protein